MSLILNLSKYVSIPILENWLYLNELPRFDSAVCNTSMRKVLLSILHFENGAAFKIFEDDSFRILQWILIRHINISDITLHCSERIKENDVINQSTMEVRPKLCNSSFLSWLFVGCVTTSKRNYISKAVEQLTWSDLPGNLLNHFDIMGEHNKLTYLDLSDCYFLTDSILISILTYSAKLHTVNLSNCGHITDSSMVTLGSKNREIHSITFSGCTLLTDVGICAVARGCGQKLLLLDIYDCFRISEQSIAEIASYCTELRHFNMGYNRDYYHQYMMLGRLCFNNRAVEDIITHCPHLTYLNTDRCTGMEETGVDVLSKYGHSLQTLIISRFVFMEQELTSLAAGCPQLHTFHITQSNAALFKCSIIAQFLSRCHNLTDISLCGAVCNCSTCFGVIAQYTRLVHLNLSDCQQVNNTDLDKILLANQNTLKSLILSNCKFLQMTGSNALCFTLCVQLTELNLHGISMIADCFISEIAKSCQLLTTLHCGQLYSKAEATDNDICMNLLHLHTLGFDCQSTGLLHSVRLYTFCYHYNKQLISLSLYYATLGNEDMIGIAEYCPNLTCLSLQECYFEHVSDNALETMFKACTKLRKLNLSKSNFKPYILILIANNCPVLHYLNLIGSCDVDDEVYNMLKSKCTCLTLLGLGVVGGRHQVFK